MRWCLKLYLSNAAELDAGGGFQNGAEDGWNFPEDSIPSSEESLEINSDANNYYRTSKMPATQVKGLDTFQ